MNVVQFAEHRTAKLAVLDKCKTRIYPKSHLALAELIPTSLTGSFVHGKNSDNISKNILLFI